MNSYSVQAFGRAVVALAFFLGGISFGSYAQTVLTIAGEVTKPLTLQAADLKALPHAEVTAKDRDGKVHRYAGIPLFRAQVFSRPAISRCW